MALTIAAQQLRSIRHHAEASFPEECCGVLLGNYCGDDHDVVLVVGCENTSNAPRKRYEIDTPELIRVQRDGRRHGLEIVGFYHSHPEHDPVWSETDLRDAEWIGCSYLIVEVRGGEAKEQRSFVLYSEPKKRFVEEELKITN